MASGDTKTQQYLDIAANGTRADLPSDTCCETRTQTLIRGVAERIMDVEDEVERLENNPDVADIVATYADLQAYPTSQLTDKDVIRVLQDETHDGSSTYYRWSTTTQTWTYIGESKQYSDFVGTDGTAGGQNGLVPAPVATDAGKFLNANGSWEEVDAGSITELTSTDYNYDPQNTGSDTAFAMWLLEPGWYEVAESGHTVYSQTGATFSSPILFVVGEKESSASNAWRAILAYANSTWYGGEIRADGSASGFSRLSTNVVQATGNSTTAVMSQNATTSMVFADPSTKYRVLIGGANANGANATAVGRSTEASGASAVAIGSSAEASALGSVAVGANSEATAVGQFDISNTGGGGYNNSNYRLLTGLYDPQNAHDAATKGYVDTAVSTAGGASLSNAEFNTIFGTSLTEGA